MYYSTTYSSPLGAIDLLFQGLALVGAWLPTQSKASVKAQVIEVDDPLALPVVQWLEDYFAGRVPSLAQLQLSPLAGSPFQNQVWRALQEIPYGQTLTYGDLAKKVALQLGRQTMSAQAIGQAVGRNPISIIIPCHRILGQKGKLTGYNGGLAIKSWLLDHEGISYRKVGSYES